MRYILIIPQPPHYRIKYFRRLSQPKSFDCPRIAEPKTRYARHHDMERLLCSSAKARQAVRIGQCVDDFLNFDERGWEVVTEEKWNSIVVLGSLVDEVDA